MEYYYIYKITCTAGSFKDHYYIGQRKCQCLPENDKYKGSGILIQDYYKKHPHEYTKEIICFCNDANELNEKEKQYIGDLYKTDPLCLNLRQGGTYSNMDYTKKRREKIVESNKHRWDNKKDSNEYKEYIKKLKEKQKGHTPWNKGKVCPQLSVKRTDEQKKHYSYPRPWNIRPRTADEIKRISESLTGRIWCNNGVINKFVREIPNGFVPGRLEKRHWYNNGIINKFVEDCPEGFISGKIKINK